MFRSMSNPLYLPACKRARKQFELGHDAFLAATGSDCAIVMAGHGIPVAPFEKPTAPVKALRLLAPLSDDIDIVAKNFAEYPAASIGYSSCAAPFYILLTNCLRTLRKAIVSDNRLQEARQLVKRNGLRWPTGTIASFQHAMFVFPREAGDRISMALVRLHCTPRCCGCWPTL
jgi:hypothetical protein